jgi:hypothetical protein
LSGGLASSSRAGRWEPGSENKLRRPGRTWWPPWLMHAAAQPPAAHGRAAKNSPPGHGCRRGAGHGCPEPRPAQGKPVGSGRRRRARRRRNWAGSKGQPVGFAVPSFAASPGLGQDARKLPPHGRAEQAELPKANGAARRALCVATQPGPMRRPLSCFRERALSRARGEAVAPPFRCRRSNQRRCRGETVARMGRLCVPRCLLAIGAQNRRNASTSVLRNLGRWPTVCKSAIPGSNPGGASPATRGQRLSAGRFVLRHATTPLVICQLPFLLASRERLFPTRHSARNVDKSAAHHSEVINIHHVGGYKAAVQHALLMIAVCESRTVARKGESP